MKFLFNGKRFRDFGRDSEKHGDEMFLVIENDKAFLESKNGFVLESDHFEKSEHRVSFRSPLDINQVMEFEKSKSVLVEISDGGIDISSVEY